MADKHELRDKGLRLTPQRELVLSAVRELGHATPEEVAEKVRQTHPGINLSTVYRNLETLENVGLVQHTHLGHGGATYHAAEDVVRPAMPAECLLDRNALIIGYAGVYSSFLKHAIRQAERYDVPASQLLYRAGKRKLIGGQEDQLIDIALEIKREQAGRVR